MADAREDFALEEYRALRATIRERGTTRLIVTAITFIGWAVALILGWPLLSSVVPGALVPLILLAAGFEAGLAAHVAAERVGRYIFVQYESAGRAAPRWEHAVMSFSRRPPALSVDPLNGVLFQCAIVVNLMPLLLRLIHGFPFPDGSVDATVEALRTGDLGAAAVVALAHGLFVIRVRRALQFARRQRDHDVEILRQPD